jgi:hypothetical protein
MGSLPFYRTLWDNMPFLRMIRYPAKINLLFLFSLCAMAGHGFDLLFKLEPHKLKNFLKLAMGTGVALMLFYVLLEVLQTPILKFYKRNFVPVVKIEDFIDSVLIYDAFVKSLFWYVLVVLSAFFVIYLAAGKGIKNTVLKYTILVLSVAISISYNRGSNALYATVAEMSSVSPVTNFLLRDADFINKRVLAPGIINQLEYDIDADKIEGLFYYKRDCLLPNVPMYHGIANADGFDSLILGDFIRLKNALNALEKPWDHPAFSLLNVKYISSTPELSGRLIKKRFKGMNYIFEYENPSGPAYFIPASTGWPGGKKTEKIGEAELPFTSAAFMKNSHDKSIVFKRLNVNVFEVSALAREKGTLVVSENFFPGWNAYENGKKISVFKANVCFMAVGLEAGNHKILFKYEPFVFFFSAIISLMALSLLTGAGLLISKNSKVKIQSSTVKSSA